MIKQILTDKDSILLIPSDDVDLSISDNELKLTITDLLDTVLDLKGFGLSAPQIEVHKRVIVVLNTKKEEYEIYINPKIIVRSRATRVVLESCFSRPNKFANMKRNKEIIVEAYNMDMQKVIIKAKGVYSVIFQHQIDILDGLLIGRKGNIIAISKDIS